VSLTLTCYGLPDVFPCASTYLGAGDATLHAQAAASFPRCGTPPGRKKVCQNHALTNFWPWVEAPYAGPRL